MNSISIRDALFFDEIRRGPDGGLTLQFEAVKQFDAEEKLFANELPQGLIFQQQAMDW